MKATPILGRGGRGFKEEDNSDVPLNCIDSRSVMVSGFIVQCKSS